MKILLVVDDYMPNSIKVAAKMMHELACELLFQGHQVSVVTPDATLSKNLDILELDGITIYRFKSGEIKNVSKMKRALNETLLSWKAWKCTKSIFQDKKFDLVVYYSPSIFFAPYVYRLKKLWDANTYLVLRDFFPQWVVDNKILSPYSPITIYFRLFEKINYFVADTIGVMSQKNLDWFKTYYKTKKPLEVLYNWAKLETVCSDASKYKVQLGIENKVVFFYGGNLGHAQDMINLIRLAKNMESEANAYFVLVGAGDEVELIRNYIDNTDMKNITLLPPVNQEEYKQMLAEFEVGLFTLNKNHKTHNFPGKLLGYMAQEMPVLGSVNPKNDLKDILDSYSAGLISINGEDDALYQNARLLMDREYRNEMGRNGKKLLGEKFSVQLAVKQILNMGLKA